MTIKNYTPTKIACTKCKLYKTAHTVCVMGQGPKHCDVMIISDIPENDIDRPFYSDYGKLLLNLLEESGLDLKKVYITHVLHCRPPEGRKPKKGEISACLDWLQKEIIEVNPKFILLLGDTALSAFPEIKSKGKITQVQSRWFKVGNEINVMPALHPGAILRAEGKRYLLVSALAKFATVINNGKMPEAKGLNFRIVRNMNDARDMLEDIEFSSRFASFDIETTSLEPWTPEQKITLVGIGLYSDKIIMNSGHPELGWKGPKQWIVPFNHPESPWKDTKNHKALAQLIADRLNDKIVVTQNGKFDSLWMLKKYGVDIRVDHDTMMMAHLLDENSPVGLKPQSARFCGAPDYDLMDKEKTGDCPLEVLAKYCAMDVMYTRKLLFIHSKRMVSDLALTQLYSKVIVPMVTMYRDIEMEGVYIDESKMQDAEKYLTEQVAEIKAKLDKYKKDINWNSTQQLGLFLFDELKLHKVNGYSTAESVLKELELKHEVPGLVLKYRENLNLLSKFITSWKDKIVDHRIHPSYKLNGTVTGRPSCENPNLQQTPRDTRIRSLITAPPGWELTEWDLSQAELRIAAVLSGDRAMKLAFQTGIDIHAVTAGLISGKDPSKMTKEELKDWRKKAKPVNFGFLYGMGVETFLKYAWEKYQVRFTQDEGQAFRDRFFEKYNGLPPWYERQHRTARMNGYVRSLSGRIRHLPDIASEDKVLRSFAERQSVNSPVQGLVPDLITMGLLEVHESFSPQIVRIVGTIHDAGLIIIKKGYLEEVLPQIKRMIEEPKLVTELGINLTVPLVVEVSVGPWSAGKVWEGK